MGRRLGGTFLRAPLNVALSPILVLTRIRRIPVPPRRPCAGAADWLARRRVLLRTAVARRVEVLVVTDFCSCASIPARRPVIRPPCPAPSLRRRSFAE